MYQFFAPSLDSRRGFFLVIAVLAIVFLGIVVGQLPYAYYMANFSVSDHQTTVLFLLVLPFATGLLALLLGVHWLHGQSPITLMSPSGSLDWKRIIRSFAVWFVLLAIGEVILFGIDKEAYVWNFEWTRWLPLIAVAIFWLPIQTSFEEILFRGYLLQRIGIGLNNRWLAVLITSVLFGALHLANPEVVAFGVTTMMIYYVSVGLLLGICTVLDQRLELALGLHAATNVYGAAVVTFKESAIQTPAIIRLLKIDAKVMTFVFLISALLFFLYFARQYRWKMTFSPKETNPQTSEPMV